MLEKFHHPDSEFRGVPFWAWNSKLEPDELRRQIAVFREMGFGGFFMHSRVGLATEYLGKEWFDCIRVCIDEARKYGMKAWLYDEDRWPSGAAGGKATRDDRFKMKDLRMECAADFNGLTHQGTTLAVFCASVDVEKRKVISYRRIDAVEDVSVQKSESLLRFYWKNEEKSCWFNGETYLDTLNPEAVRNFMKETHEVYRRAIYEHFGHCVPGIFSDEPCLSYARGDGLPWTPFLPEAFQLEYGYDLLDVLPELFFYTEEEVSHARWAYFNLVTKLFVESFAKQLGEWCALNHMALTGHVLGEDQLSSQAAYSGAPMRFYEYMQQPGIDLLTEHWNIFTTVKQCVSVARQLGKPRRLSESYACTGWDFSFAGHKALGDWQYALGINFLCEHLAWYSMEGEAKRDFPASISFQSPWFRKYRYLQDYFARLGSVISHGEEIRELLVIHPIENYWATDLRYTEHLPAVTAQRDHAFELLSQELLAEKLDFDYGDEEMMSRLGAVKQGILWVGHGQYKAVLIPEINAIRKTTLDLLEAFAEAGGLVCYLGEPPQYVDARQSRRAQEIYGSCFTAVTAENAVEVLSPAVRRVAILNREGQNCRSLLCHPSRHSEYTSFFVCNLGKEFSEQMMQEVRVCERTQAVPWAEIILKLPQQGMVYELNAESGEIYSVENEYADGAYHLKTSFAPLESRLFIVTEQVVQVSERRRNLHSAQKLCNLPVDGWRYTLDEPNVMVLDHADYSVDGQKKAEQAFVLHIDAELRKMLKANPRGEAMIQPWLEKQDDVCRPSLDVSLEYVFQCDDVPEECSLVLEHPEIFHICLNGRLLSLNDSGWWMDRALRVLPLPDGTLEKGRNVLELSCRYHAGLSGLENLYLLGRFGVSRQAICSVPETLSLGDWCLQGFPYYAGNVTYSRDVDLPDAEEVFLNISDWRGCALGIQVNDGPEKLLAWPPYELEVTQWVHAGRNRFYITVYSSRRNAFGPFYTKDKWPKFLGPGHFLMHETQERQVVPCGLFQGEIKITGGTLTK